MTFSGSNALPPNATALERAMADTDWARVSLLNPDVIRSVTDPATCPVDLLPWLAWAVSVDVWDDDWDEATRRAVIAAAPGVARTKGTRHAVSLALSALGVSCDLVEWWENAPETRRGTFDITLYGDGTGPPVTVGLIEQARRSVTQAKRKSVTFKLHLGLRPTGMIYMAGSQQNVLSIAIAAG